MINEGRGYGVAVALRLILNKLVGKGVLSRPEVMAMLDSACEEIGDLQRRHVLSPGAASEAGRTVGLLYLPDNVCQPIQPKDLTAENDE
jgi:hypothetical protein